MLKNIPKYAIIYLLYKNTYAFCARNGEKFMHIYQRIKDLREDRDKSQTEIAEILGMKQQQYARYEIGVQEIPVHHLITLAKYYNVSLDYLVGLSDKK